jgi:hypothetical protein
MSRLHYVDHRFSPAVLQVVRQAEVIIDDYARQGFDLTLRQLYYQFVSRGWIPNRQREYDRLGRIVNDARLAGLLPWDRIVDRTRNVRALPHWATPAGVVQAAARSYREDLWRDQRVRAECWIEKDALVGVFEAACEDMHVPLFSCRGYTSQSEVWAAAQRLERYMESGQDVVILHFGDHDPSGIDMTRDIEERLRLFLWRDWIRWITKQGEEAGEVPLHGSEGWREKAIEYTEAAYDTNWRDRLEVRRMALNFEQVEQYDPPPNPAKDTDSRFEGYRAQYGDESWELDALEPAVLDALIRGSIDDLLDADLYAAAEAKEQEGVQLLEVAARRWGDLEEVLRS